MCGICGIVGPSAPSKAVLRAMNSTLHRRGPDDEGYYIDPAGCGLGHRRLSIIDLEGGRQPLGSADGSIQVVVNGEIYNFKALRQTLRERGYRFATDSDSEVVVHGYDAWGLDLLEKLHGMFALAIWDGRQKKLVLARDRMGQKPLYYALIKDTLIFGSELKSLAAHPDFEREVDPAAFSAYLAYECVPEALAIYRSAAKVQPGTWLTYEPYAGRMQTGSFWQIRFSSSPWQERVSRMSQAELLKTLRTLIREGTKARLISDVPLGVLLSGGLDSSAITAAMAQEVPPDQIKTFSITFEDKSFDESAHARKVAKHLGTQHYEERLSPEVMINILPEVADFMCEPLGDASIIPTYLLSRFTRETVTVALGGDGGDELFLGYPTFTADKVARSIDGVLGLGAERKLGAGIQALAGLLPVSRKNFSFDFKLKRFAQGLGFAPDHRHQAWMGSFMPHELNEVISERYLAAAMAHNPYAVIADFRTRADYRDHSDRDVYQYSRLYLTADVLVKVDRASMARGLEVRAPLLHTELIEFANALPGDLKLKGLTTKYLLKEAARPWLPDEIIDRPKKGFGVPVADWLRGPLNGMARDLLAPHKLKREGFFNEKRVAAMLEEHEQGQADHRKPLWTMLAFELWLERYGPGTRAAPIEDPGEDHVAIRAVG